MDHLTPKKDEAKAFPEQADPNAEEDDLIAQAAHFLGDLPGMSTKLFQAMDSSRSV
jgi:hypothetical protein